MAKTTQADLEIIIAKTPEDIEAVKSIFQEYLDFIEGFLCQPLDFQGTEKEFSTFPDVYDFLLLAKLNEAPVAACGVKAFKADVAELKRLYARSSGRGHGLGEKLTVASMDESRRRGFKEMYLDTDPGLTHAVAIYEKLGFEDIPATMKIPWDVHVT